MSTNDHNQKIRLFEEFPPVPTEEWEAAIKEELKGADYERKLIWKTQEGFDIKPYYREEHLENLDYLKIYPGDFPFIRTNQKTENNWFIRQDILVNDIAEANKKALDILLKGIDSLGWVLPEHFHPTMDDIERLMENIYAHAVEVNFVCGIRAPRLLEIYLGLVKKYNRDLQKIHGSVDFDPIGHLISTGNFYSSEEEDFNQCAEIVRASAHVPHFRTLAVKAFLFKNAGSTIVEELGFGLAYANEYLQKVTDRGVSIDEVAPNIKFHFGIGSSYFMEIAKLRAARMLWAKIVNAYGPSDVEITRTHIHSITTDWNKTLYDPYVNMLRTTTEAMSAIIGGTNSLTVKPYDAVFRNPSEFSERIARNQQLLLKEESYFNKIVDPAAGSYFLENLTDSIAEHAWKLFLQITDMGGFVTAFKNGFVQEKLRKTAHSRNEALSSRKTILVGTNQYPDFNEIINELPDPSVIFSNDQQNEPVLAEPLRFYRASQPFERLRLATDQYSLKNRRPVVFLLTYGNLAMRRARAQFSANFFACAGYQIIDNNGFETVDQGIEAALNNNPDIVVICASDEDYPSIAPEIQQKIGDRTIVVVAGYPKDHIEELQSKGVSHFIHIRSNVLETLQYYNQLLGIPEIPVK